MQYQDFKTMSQYAYVSGLEGAKAYQMLPNQSMLLMDNDQPMFYLKQTNSTGQSSLRCFRFEEVQIEQERPVTQREFSQLSATMADIQQTLRELKEAKHESDS